VPSAASADPAPPVDGAEAVRRFLSVYGPSTPAAFGEWAGVARGHARRLWDAVAGELTEAGGGWILAADRAALASPPTARGTRLLPPGDPYLQKPNRSLLAGDEATRKRLFRPSAGPGAVLRDGRLVGLWRAKAKGRRTTAIEVEALDGARLRRAELQDEAARVAALRGTPDVALALS
jgi:hypothetical protein